MRKCGELSFNEAVELLFPLVTALEEISKPVALDQHILSRPLDDMSLANEVLETLAKQLERKDI